jgi:CRISPR-associated protein Csb2
MRSYLCLTINFLSSEYHGQGVDGEPEWPPSPLRLFQALVAAAKARSRIAAADGTIAAAFHWLERQPSPLIVAPCSETGHPFCLSVPNNDMDMIARSWAKGQESRKQPSELRTLKTVQTRHMLDGATVHYVWQVSDADLVGAPQHLAALCATSRDVVALGRGIDLVAGYGRVISQDVVDDLPGERWQPTSQSDGGPSRVPIAGTLQELEARHECFLTRVLPTGDFNPVPPLRTFREVVYRRDNDAATRPFAAFQMVSLDARRFRVFDPTSAVVVAGMTRHAVASAGRAAGRAESWINEYILGHGPAGPAKGAPNAPRFAYLPLPTIDPRGVASGIRRILVAEAPGGTGSQIAWVTRSLGGQELTNKDSKAPEAILSLIPAIDPVVRNYVRESAVWSSITPVVLPGYDDGSPERTIRLLRKSIQQSGFPVTLARHAELAWRHVGFRPGLEMATQYHPPAYLKSYPKYHVRIHWRDASGRSINVRGPVVIGAGRYCGLGVMSADE